MSEHIHELSSHLFDEPAAAVPNATAVEDDLLAALADDFAARVRRQERPEVEQYAAKHPELADRICKLFPTIVLMEESRSFDATATAGGEGPGSMIGRYKLLERIGEGGFGVVYMAEQQHPVRRKVALKVIKSGLDTRQVIARFEAERQALAMMDHPNIAKVLDAGATDSCRPYFVMELVKGAPITQYCDGKHLTLSQRLVLFATVCQAVQHAHQKAIIHRDIKPTNVLVAEYDDQAIAKIIDFGVAKAVKSQLTEKTMFTEFGQLIGTLEYMSPEQAKLNQLDIDTRSDIYSLGVLLYELLAGTTPLDRKRLKDTSLLELLRIVREQDAPTLSNRLNTTAELPAIAANRALEPAKLTKLVRGELDWIVMKALEKDRNRRYETASAFAADVERYLQDEPVEACPPSGWYRVRKFARRQSRVLLTAAVIASAVLLTAAGSGVLIWRANQDLHQALDRERDTLERERSNSYTQRIALANREWSANNLSGMEELLAECPKDLRGWEWHYLKRLRYSTLRPLRHNSPVLSVAFSPDGQYVATATQAGVLRIWQAKSGQLCQKWSAQQSTTHSVVFSPNSLYLASGSWDGTVKIWEMKKVIEGEVNEPLMQLQHDSNVRSVAFSPDGERLAVASGRAPKKIGEVKIWNMNTRREELTLEFSTQVNCVQFSPDGRQIAAADTDSLTLWDAHTGHQQLICRDPDRPLQGVAFSPDGRRLATVGGLIAVHPDREIKIWDARTGQEIQSLRGHVGGLRSVAFSPDGSRLASCGLDQTVKLWDTASGEEVLTLRGHLDNVFDVAFSADGRQLASASVDKTVRIWDATPLEREPAPEHLTLRGHEGAVTDVAFHPTDGRSLVSAGTDGTVRVWNARSGTEPDILHVPSYGSVKVAYSPDGRRLAVVSGESGWAAVTIWDTASAKQTDIFRGQNNDLCVAFSPDGEYVASAGMASPSMEFDVRVREAMTGTLLSVAPNHTWPIFGVAFSPDGRYLASCSSDSTVRICDWKTGEQLPPLRPHHAGRAAGVAFSSDGQWLASASWDRTIKVWESLTWELLYDLPDPTGAALCVAFGPDRRLVWGSTDGTVKIWDGPDQELHVLRGHTSWVQAVSFSTDGKWIASASLDGTVKIWRAPPVQKAVAQDVEDAQI